MKSINRKDRKGLRKVRKECFILLCVLCAFLACFAVKMNPIQQASPAFLSLYLSDEE
jgi:hypothetical protein